MFIEISKKISNLHDEFDHFHELLQLGDFINLEVFLVDVEPALADISE